MPEKKSTAQPFSDTALQIAECFAAIYPAAPARSKAMKWINVARKAIDGNRGIVHHEMSDAIEELVAAGVLEPSIEGRNRVPARGPKAVPGTITRFCEGLYERGFYPIILRELESTIYVPYYQRVEDNAIPRELTEQHVRYALVSNSFERFTDDNFPPDIWLWLIEPRAKNYLQKLPESHRRQAGMYGMHYLIHNLQPVDVFARTCASLDSAAWHTLLLARARVYQGNFTDAQKLIDSAQHLLQEDKRSRVECEALRAMIATFHGDDATAKQHIEATIAIERSGTRKRNVYPDTLCLGIASFSLIRLGTPESRALFQTLLDAREKLKITSELDWLLVAANCADQPETYLGAAHPQGMSIMSVLDAIGSRWHDEYHFPQSRETIHRWLATIRQRAIAGGYHWVAAEVQTVMEADTQNEKQRSKLIKDQFDNITAAALHEQLGTQTLTKLVEPMEAWEFSLRELEQLALKTKPSTGKSDSRPAAESRRLVWQLNEIRGGAVYVNPLEQSLGKSGKWTGGRRVALKRLKEEATSLTHLIAQDVKASAAIRKVDYGWSGGVTYETDERTVYQLQGHPCVFDKIGDRYDIVEQAPALKLSDVDGALQLSIEPAFDGAHYRTRMDRDNRRVSVTHFTAAHRRIAESVPQKGLLLPSFVKERLLSMLDALSSDISVLADGDTVDGTAQEGSALPVIAMEPFGQSLRVRIRVEPLPETGSFFDAGSGGEVVYVQTTSGTVPVRRDLQEERNQVQDIVSRSEVLASHYDGRSFFVIDETVDALELLEELQDAGVRCIWPSDIPFRIKARANVRNINLNIKSAKEWFTASGNLTIDDETMTLAQLLRLMQAQPQSRFIELGKGEFLSLSRTLKQQLDTLQAFVKTERSESDSNKLHPMALLSLDPLLDNAKLVTDKALKVRRAQINQALVSIASVPATLQADLRTYQQDGFVWLERLGQMGAGACLADDMGLGKTVQSLALLLSRAEGGPALVVAPTSVVGNWLQETQRFAPSLCIMSYADSELGRHEILSDLGAYDVVVISYGLVVNDIEQLQKIHWHTVILDEAQAIKNANTRRARSVKQLAADFRVVTTGTPVQNNLMDLHSLFGFLNPRLLGSEAEFRARYAVPISRDNNHFAREQLQTLVSPFLLRRHKRDVLKELPARTELTLNVTLSQEESALYELIRQEALDSLDDENGNSDDKSGASIKGETPAPNPAQQKIIILSYLTKLRRLCCNPSLITPGWSGPMSKLDVFSDTLNELLASGHKALVFSQFVDHLKIVEAHLKKQSISYQYLDGSTSAKQRTARVSAFQGGDGDVFLISLTAGGTGLNLTAADYVIHLDPWWNPAVEDQASDRAHRLGQQRPVTIVRMVTTGTIEEQIQTLHSSKRELADSVLSGANNATLDVETMIRLLRG